MRFLIGEIGLVAIMLISALMGVHVVLLVIFGWRIVTLFWWILAIVPAIGMAAAHPRPHSRRPGRLR